MKAVLAIDQGTTGTTCLVIDERGKVRGRGYVELPQHFPEPGRVEHDPREIWASVVRAGRLALAAAGVEWALPVGAGPDIPAAPAKPRGASDSLIDVACIGITNQRETTILWDRATGDPIHRAIVWQDRRTADRCRELTERGFDGLVRERTGLVLDPYFSATKIAWLLDNVAGARSRAEAGDLAFGTVDTWLIWQLTGERADAGAVHVTEPTNASRTLLFDIRLLDWSQEMLELFRVPRRVLPEVRRSSSRFGVASAEVFGKALPITGVAGDQQAALYGQTCFSEGQAKNTYGTGAFLLLHTGADPVGSESGLLTTVACGARGEAAYALEGSIFIAGAAVQWLRDGVGVIGTAAETAELAGSLQSNDGVYFVPAFVGLGAPHWDPEVRGTIVGLTRGCTRAHLARAALESMAYGTREVLEAMAADAGVRLEELAVDGGAAANDWLMQFQADILGVPIRRPRMVETTALGAAGLAGLAAGVWEEAGDFAAALEAPTVFEPRMGDEQRARHVAGWTRAVAAAKAWADFPDPGAGSGAESGPGRPPDAPGAGTTPGAGGRGA